MLELLLSVAVAPQPIEDTAIQTIQEQSIKVETEVEEPTTHEIKENETLEKIAKQHKVGWQRIFDKNTELENPHAIEVGDILVIPDNDETLPERVYAVYLPPTPVVTESSVAAVRSSPVAVSSGTGLIGSYGSVKHYGNCVNEEGVNNPGRGNPITWQVTSSTPTIGATALWNYNHTGVVTGIYEGGEYIEVRHQNFSGTRTKFHISEFRGYR